MRTAEFGKNGRTRYASTAIAPSANQTALAHRLRAAGGPTPADSPPVQLAAVQLTSLGGQLAKGASASATGSTCKLAEVSSPKDDLCSYGDGPTDRGWFTRCDFAGAGSQGNDVHLDGFDEFPDRQRWCNRMHLLRIAIVISLVHRCSIREYGRLPASPPRRTIVPYLQADPRQGSASRVGRRSDGASRKCLSGPSADCWPRTRDKGIEKARSSRLSHRGSISSSPRQQATADCFVAGRTSAIRYGRRPPFQLAPQTATNAARTIADGSGVEIGAACPSWIDSPKWIRQTS
ncbi:hypothetical protein Pla175_28530 [Pirellulimonas nuda]|uniref:Uncharacterized protein n=1 Tax=Pirellulimonas nuda TaxID=2528009 RepID=A0A518DDD1_9BACT|nr:hypothetical protein Pla175_28530 [Pirellulimonas nuda]